jgi:hypothetical protein
MGTKLRTTWQGIDATTLDDFSREITDNITSQQIVLWILDQMGGWVTKPGGNTIVIPTLLEDNASVKWMPHFGQLDMTHNDPHSAAQYAWKILAGVAQISHLEKFQNSGPAGIIDLWDARGDALATTMFKKTNTAMYSDGSIDDGNALVGFLSAIENGDSFVTYGTIDSSTVTNWQNQFVDGDNINAAAGAGITNLFAGLRTLHVKCTRQSDYPDVCIMTQTLWLKFLEGLESKEQITRQVNVNGDEAMANAGFRNITYMGIPHYQDIDMLPNTTGDDAQGAIDLNLKYVKFVSGEGYTFEMTDPQRPDNQLTESIACELICNLAVSNRKVQGRADFATT